MQFFLRSGVVALTGTLAALVAGAALAGTASPAKIIVFKAKYAGIASVKVTDNVADIAAAGAGTATLLRASKITGKGKGDASQTPCVPFTGPGSMFNATGTKISFLVLPGSTGCGDQDESVPVSVSGRAKIVKGTRAYRNAKGTLKFSGVYDRVSGKFSITFTGRITVP